MAAEIPTQWGAVARRLVLLALPVLPGGLAADQASPELPGAGLRVVVSVGERWLWLVDGDDVLVSVAAAVGRARPFRSPVGRHTFETPLGERRVVGKRTDPVWTPPDWHYYEKAAIQGLEVVPMERDVRYELADGTHLEIRGDQVGRINHFGHFWPWPPGGELIFDGRLYMPPIGTAQRRIPDALGDFALDLGSGYMIHGTHEGNRGSVGDAVSHGCVRLDAEPLKRVYGVVEVGTPVFIIE